MSRGTIDFDDEPRKTNVSPSGSIDIGTDTPTEEPVRKKGFKTSFIGSDEEEDRKGTWKGTDYNASNEEAHRDARYSIPSWLKQTVTMFMVQMKLFSKAKWTYVALFTALLIPILVIGAGDTISNMLYMFGFSTTYSNTYIAGLLAFLPLFIGLYTSVLCGSQIPNEFKDRTAYLNVSLPISRSSFYIGKYLAGLILCLGIFMFAYGSAVATAMMRYDTIFSDLLGESLMLTIIAVFAYSATAFCVGSFMKRGSSLIPFILMSVIIPVIVLLVGSYTENWALGYLPSFLGEAALGLLGSIMTGSVGMPILGNIDLNNIVPMAVVGVVWGFAFLILGLMQTKRREM